MTKIVQDVSKLRTPLTKLPKNKQEQEPYSESEEWFKQDYSSEKIDIQNTIRKELSNAYPTKIHFSPSPDEETMFTKRFTSKKT